MRSPVTSLPCLSGSLLILLVLFGCGGPAHKGLSDKEARDLAGRISSYVDNSGFWEPFFQQATIDPGVMLHMLLICKKGCSLANGENLYDYVFKSGRVALKDLDNHRAHTLDLLANLDVPLDERLRFQEGRWTVRELLEKGIENLYHPTELEKNFGDLERGWLLCALGHYLPVTSRMINKDGLSTSFLRLMTEVITNNSLPQFTEGGTHELIGLACGIKKLEGEAQNISEEYKPVLGWARGFLRIKINDFLDHQSPEGDFNVPFQAGPIFRFFKGLAGPRSLNIAIAGHILTVIGTHMSREELLSDKRISKATDRLLDHMIHFREELLPMVDLTGRFEDAAEMGRYQRTAYAHAFDALRLIRDKLRAGPPP